MNAIGVIPSRYGSTRLPAKALLRETGKYLVEHVYEQAAKARRLSRVVVATDDPRIADAVRSFGGEALLTRADHVSGTDRVAEVADRLGGDAETLYLNVQGDEPEIEPAYLDRLVERMAGGGADCPVGTLACRFPPDADPSAPSAVKVVTNALGQALYFSRSLIPYARDGGGSTPGLGPLLHLGVYAYRRPFLLQLASWPPGVLEQIEKLEQLRVLERGYAIAVEIVEHACAGIDTPRDYEQFVSRFRERRGPGC